ncbi:MAG: DUF790 family protein [Candidatus Njordarchaeum guaymaensis]
MIKLDAFPFRRYSDRIVVDFLSENKYYTLMQKVINLMDNLVNTKIQLQDLFNELEKIIGNEKLTKLLVSALKYFYDFKQPEIYDYVKEKKFLYMDSWELRKNFFLWVQERYNGFIPTNEREKAIEYFCKLIGVNPDSFDNYLRNIWRDFRLIKKKFESNLNPQKLIGVCNFLLLEKALSLSENVKLKLEIDNNLGFIIKNLVFRSKKARILADFKLLNGELECLFSGPYAFFETPTSSYGSNFAYVILDILTKVKKWELTSILCYKKKKYKFQARNFGQWGVFIVLPWEIKESKESLITFDSEIEKHVSIILNTLAKSRNWRVIREADAIFLPSKRIFIPDFTIVTNGKKILIEVVGFWTKKYAIKKREKLLEYLNEGLKNILLIIDKRLESYFKDLEIPKVFYKQNKIPLAEIYKELKKML